MKIQKVQSQLHLQNKSIDYFCGILHVISNMSDSRNPQVLLLDYIQILHSLCDFCSTQNQFVEVYITISIY